MNRRDFVKTCLLLGLGMATGLTSQSQQIPNTAQSAPTYKITGWSGNEFALPHRFRDGFLPNTAPAESQHDVVVVGGGLCGLMMAYHLRDRDLLVLESEANVGGNAKAIQHKDIEFNIGSAYFTDGDLETEQGKFLAELGIELSPVEHPTDTWYHNNQWGNIWDDEDIAKQPEDLRKAMQGLKKTLSDITDSDDYPGFPYEASTAKALELDKITFAQWLSPYAHPALMALINSYCYSAFGASSDTISAYAGINFYSEILGNIYSSQEGNYQIVKALVQHINKAGSNRIQKGAYVYKIVPVSQDLAKVFYMRMGRNYVVSAKKVILAVPYFQVAYLIDGLSSGQRRLLNFQHYSSYIVANLRFKQVISHQAYDNWVPSLSGTFEDFIPIGWANPYKRTSTQPGQIITIFSPCHHPIWGRMRMMDEPSTIAQEIVAGFAQLYPDSIQYLEEVFMTRWGHAMMIPQPLVFTNWLAKVKKQIGPIWLVHTDGQGCSAVETAFPETMEMLKKIEKS